MAVLDPGLTALVASDEGAAPGPDVPPEVAAQASAAVDSVSAASSPPAVPPDPAVAALCTPVSDGDPCGPDLDLEGDTDYLNFFAQVEGVLPASFFNALDGAPFDRSAADIGGQLEAIKPLLARTRDIRLLIMQARLQILNRDLIGFAVSLAAAAYWLDAFWDQVHPRPNGDDLTARSTAVSALDPAPPYTPTVLFPLQYAPLFEGRRVGAISYRRLMIANDEVKARAGEEKLAVPTIMEARSEADPEKLAATRKYVVMLKAALDRIRSVFAAHGLSAGLDSLPALVDKVHAFIDPVAAAEAANAPDLADGSLQPGGNSTAAKAAGPGPTSLAEASEALAAIADYYSRLEPSSPTLPLVRQAHQLIGKSFIDIMKILIPTQIDKAAFQIGGDQVFDLPVGGLSSLSAVNPGDGLASTQALEGVASHPTGYSVKSRSQAIALLEQVQRFFRAAEPSSPVPMLCERARALAERDFMGVLRDVLPKAALKNVGADK